MGIQEGSSCKWCKAPRETIRHLLLECRQWREERRNLYKALAKAKAQAPSAAEDCPGGRLFGDPKATKALLEFLATTAVGCPRGEPAGTAERAQADDNWGIEVLDEEEREGES